MKISQNSMVTFQYTLTDEKGENLGHTDEPQNVTYRHGYGEIIKGLESAMTGREPNEKFQVEIPPEFAYGKYNSDLVEVFPREHFNTADGALKEGMYFEAQSDEGNVFFQITRLTDTEVTVDANHPFAGKTLRFNVEINDVQTTPQDQLDIEDNTN